MRIPRLVLVASILMALAAPTAVPGGGSAAAATGAMAAALAATAFWVGLPRFGAHLLSALMLMGVFLVARRLRRRNDGLGCEVKRNPKDISVLNIEEVLFIEFIRLAA